MKRGPVTQASVLPDIKRLDCMICALRKLGWPIETRMGRYYDTYGSVRMRAEYRLGNWSQKALPLR